MKWINLGSSVRGLWLGTEKKREQIRRMEAKLITAEQALMDIQWLTRSGGMGTTLEHKEAILEAVQHELTTTLAYLEK